jgi:D-3-phosphoglycerate dehydrogenase
MGKILITASHYAQLCAPAKEMLEKAGHTVVLNKSDMPYYSFEQLRPLVADIDAAIIGMDRWDEEIFALAPRLKAIARFGVGIDNIDLSAARQRGIKVTNALGMNANAVAELAVGYIFDMVRNTIRLNADLSKGVWSRAVGHDLKGKTVGLLGFGDIARRVAKKLSGFEVRILACDLFPNREAAAALGVTLVDEKTLLAESDIVSIHIPSTKETRHYMNRDTFAQMRKGAYFINTARGALVDSEALCDSIEAGHLGGAALDVFETEPLPKESRLIAMDKIICTPHTGAETFETYTAVSLCTAQAVIDVLNGKEPQNWVNT